MQQSENPTEFSHITDCFNIYIKCASDFLLEISKLIRTNLTDMKLNLTVLHSAAPDWDKCDSAKVENIKRKISAVMAVENNDSKNELVALFVENYISGLDILNSLRLTFPDFHEELIELENVCKRDISIKTLLKSDSDNRSLFFEIMDDFESKLRTQFSNILIPSSIGEL